MTPDEIEQTLISYAAGLEAELRLLRHLQRLADIQHAASREPNLDSINRLNDERERLMASLVKIEYEIKPLRLAIHDHRQQAVRVAGFDHVAGLHRQAAELVAAIMASDQKTKEALREAEIARRYAAQTLEMGEATLAAYRRVVMPEIVSAALVNRRG